MILDLISILFFLVAAMQFPKLLMYSSEEKHLPMIQRLVIMHFALGIVFYFFTRDGGGDAWGYFRTSKVMTAEDFRNFLFEEKGTRFMEAFNYIPAKLLGLGFLGNTMFFSMLGSFGITYFYFLVIRQIPYNKIVYGYVLFPLIFFLPNLHFWSSGVGKDTLLFLCIGMFVYALMKPLARIPLLAISILLALAVRPHIVLFLSVAFGLAYVLGGKVSIFQRIVFSSILIGIGFFILPSVMEFAKIEEASVEGFDKFAQGKADVLSRSHTGSAIDISSYPFPLKVLTFLFRPFFFDVRNIQGLISSVENLILVILIIGIFRKNVLRSFRAAPFVIKGLVLFLVIGTLAFSQSLGNVGIMIRMRNMFLPGLLIFIIWSYSYSQQIALQNQKLTKSGDDENRE